MTAQHSNDVEEAAPMSPRAWRHHVVAVLLDGDAQCQLLAAPARRPFEAARRHVLVDVDADALAARWDADQVRRHHHATAVAIDEPRPCGEPARGAAEVTAGLGAWVTFQRRSRT